MASSTPTTVQRFGIARSANPTTIKTTIAVVFTDFHLPVLGSSPEVSRMKRRASQILNGEGGSKRGGTSAGAEGWRAMSAAGAGVVLVGPATVTVTRFGSGFGSGFFQTRGRVTVASNGSFFSRSATKTERT
jgi:hypothetical protein